MHHSGSSRHRIEFLPFECPGIEGPVLSGCLREIVVTRAPSHHIDSRANNRSCSINEASRNGSYPGPFLTFESIHIVVENLFINPSQQIELSASLRHHAVS